MRKAVKNPITLEAMVEKFSLLSEIQLENVNIVKKVHLQNMTILQLKVFMTKILLTSTKKNHLYDAVWIKAILEQIAEQECQDPMSIYLRCN